MATLQSSAENLAQSLYSFNAGAFFHPQEKMKVDLHLLRALIAATKEYPPLEFKRFSRALIRAVSDQCLKPAVNAEALYRAFDAIDEVLRIDFSERHQSMPANVNKERLYESGGVGVQTSYATIFKILAHLNLPPAAHLVDLGSGFGRVGLATGLCRSDIFFTGFEFVSHRVDAANAAATLAGVEDRVRFTCQDLSAADFTIPVADAYYLYDPFSPSTYAHVLARLAEIGKDRGIIVIAKDGARRSFQRATPAGEWHEPEVIDEGGIWIFRARGA